MNAKEAMKIFGRQAPCPHDNANTALGDGKTWAECEDCGATFRQANWHLAKAAAVEYEEALAWLSGLVSHVWPNA